ncbi:hypothetical protein HPB49_022465 [Dermacentor silvarum]|uniref:Uncharacterized protein n=1 Tax=Dermacentor silvarum TaxID=543639 RepID=A0ACB8E3P2_DERSI|nr:hypothetical protein HPB49_022465 [Dermacentor silvarum]
MAWNNTREVRGVRCDSLKPCARCRVAHYCNKLCEASALSEHLPECCYFEEVFPYIPDVTVRLLTRITHKLQIYICYVDKLLLKEDRIAALQRQYYFTCNCVFCKELLVHLTRHCLASVSHDIPFSSEELPAVDVVLFECKVGRVPAESKADVERIASRCREILEYQCKELPANDVAKVETLLLGFQCGTRMAAHAEAIGLALQAMEIMRRVSCMDSSMHPVQRGRRVVMECTAPFMDIT